VIGHGALVGDDRRVEALCLVQGQTQVVTAQARLY
jgi:hypothetical protein